jgi:hypothetical protein
MGVSENAIVTRQVDIGGVLLDLVAATDYLSSTRRLGLTVWEAVEEALRWWTADRLTLPGELPAGDFADLPWADDPDPLRTAVGRVLAVTSAPDGLDGLELGVIFTTALETWVRRMAELYNDGHRFAHPAPRRGWPSPLYDTSPWPDDDLRS